MGIDIVAYRRFAFLAERDDRRRCGGLLRPLGRLARQRRLQVQPGPGHPRLRGAGRLRRSGSARSSARASSPRCRSCCGRCSAFGIGFLKNFAQLPNILNRAWPCCSWSSSSRAGWPRSSRTSRRRAGRGAGIGRTVSAAPDSAGRARGDFLPASAPLLALEGLARIIRRGRSPREREPGVRGGQDLRAHRPQRRRQDHPHQPRLGARSPPVPGRIVWLGREIQGRRGRTGSPRAGIARTFQNIQLFRRDDRAGQRHRGPSHRTPHQPVHHLASPAARRAARSAESRDEALGLLENAGPGRSGRTSEAGNLSYGDQRRVEIARALALQPRLLLLDEPAAGMNEMETAPRSASLSWSSSAHGVTLLVVEHHMDLIMGSATRSPSSISGKKIAQGDARPGFARRGQVLEAYLGRD